VFDSFVENAVDNARAKALREPEIAIRMRFEFEAGRVGLSVTDTGSPVPEPAAHRLFREPIERAAGLGIGLYHVARLASQAGYHLSLAANRQGEVRFVLVQDEAESSDLGQG